MKLVGCADGIDMRIEEEDMDITTSWEDTR